MADKVKQLEDYIEIVIEQLNQIKNNPDTEIKNEYYSLSNIAWRMELFSVQGIRIRRFKNCDEDE